MRSGDLLYIFWLTGRYDYGIPEAFLGVDDFVAVRACLFSRLLQRSGCAAKPFQTNRLFPAKFNKVHKRFKAGSGPGGRRLKTLTGLR